MAGGYIGCFDVLVLDRALFVEMLPGVVYHVVVGAGWLAEIGSRG